MSISWGSLFVRVGDVLRALPWDTAGKAIRSMRPLGSQNVLLRETPNGTIINFRANPQRFIGKFYVSLSGSSVSVTPGTVNKVRGQIRVGGVLTNLEGDSRGVVPQLDLGKGPQFGSDNRGWVAVEVTCSQLDWAIMTAEVVQVASLDTDDGKEPKDGSGQTLASGGTANLKGRRARHPLAMLVKQPDNSIRVYQNSYHNLQHRIKTTSTNPAADAGRHFFYPDG